MEPGTNPVIDKTQDPVDLEAAGHWLSHDNQDALTVEFGKRLIAEIRSLRRPSPASPAPQGLEPGTDLDPIPPEDSDLQFRLVRALLIDAWGRAWSKHPGTPHIRAALKTMVPKGLSLADCHTLDAIRDADIAVQVKSTDPRDNAPGLRNHVAASQIGFVRERLERGEAIKPEAAQVLADWLTAALGDRAPIQPVDAKKSAPGADTREAVERPRPEYPEGVPLSLKDWGPDWKPCKSCRSLHYRRWKFCPDCATPTDAALAPVASPPAELLKSCSLVRVLSLGGTHTHLTLQMDNATWQNLRGYLATPTPEPAAPLAPDPLPAVPEDERPTYEEIFLKAVGDAFGNRHPCFCGDCDHHLGKDCEIAIKDSAREMVEEYFKATPPESGAPAPDGLPYIRAFRDLVVARVQRTRQSFHAAMEDEWILALEVTPDPSPAPDLREAHRPLRAMEPIQAGDEAWIAGVGPWEPVTDARIGEPYRPWNGESGYHVAMRRALSESEPGEKDQDGSPKRGEA